MDSTTENWKFSSNNKLIRKHYFVVKKEPKSNETADRKYFVLKTFTDFEKDKSKKYSRFISKNAVFADNFTKTVRNFIQKICF